MSDFNVPGSRPKKQDEISEIDRTGCPVKQESKCTSKSIWRQGIVLKHRNSLQKSLCPVVICPYFCSSERNTHSKCALACARAHAGLTKTCWESERRHKVGRIWYVHAWHDNYTTTHVYVHIITVIINRIFISMIISLSTTYVDATRGHAVGTAGRVQAYV